jgi:hypothetical protein
MHARHCNALRNFHLPMRLHLGHSHMTSLQIIFELCLTIAITCTSSHNYRPITLHGFVSTAMHRAKTRTKELSKRSPDPISLLKGGGVWERDFMHTFDDIVSRKGCFYHYRMYSIVNGIITPLLALLYIKFCRMGIHLRKWLKNC